VPVLKKIFTYPARNLLLVIPSVMILGFVVGLFHDTSFLKSYILLFTVLMIYPTMVGFRFGEGLKLGDGKVFWLALLVNFLLTPVVAVALASAFFKGSADLMAGLLVMAIIPTSGMTISWTMLFGGNVGAAVRLTVIGLVLGAMVAPWYLVLTVGKHVPVDPLAITRTILAVIVIPLLLGYLTQTLLRRWLGTRGFDEKVRPYLPSLSVWAMLGLIFTSISLKAKGIVGDLTALLNILAALVLYYAAVFVASTLIGRWFLRREDAVALVYGTAMRNLSVALGLAVTAFGPSSALIITLAFLIQVQGAAWYGKLLGTYEWFSRTSRVGGGVKA